MVVVQLKVMALVHKRGIFVQCPLVFLTTHCIHSQGTALNLKGKKQYFVTLFHYFTYCKHLSIGCTCWSEFWLKMGGTAHLLDHRFLEYKLHDLGSETVIAFCFT